MEIIKDDKFNSIYYVDVLDKEISKLFGKSIGERNKFLNFLASALNKLDISNKPPTTMPFEKLGGKKDNIDLYRIKYKDRDNNVRVIYYWNSNDEKILLNVFKETDKSDYKESINRSLSRAKELGLYKEEKK